MGALGRQRLVGTVFKRPRFWLIGTRPSGGEADLWLVPHASGSGTGGNIGYRRGGLDRYAVRPDKAAVARLIPCIAGVVHDLVDKRHCTGIGLFNFDGVAQRGRQPVSARGAALRFRRAVEGFNTFGIVRLIVGYRKIFRQGRLGSRGYSEIIRRVECCIGICRISLCSIRMR